MPNGKKERPTELNVNCLYVKGSNDGILQYPQVHQTNTDHCLLNLIV